MTRDTGTTTSSIALAEANEAPTMSVEQERRTSPWLRYGWLLAGAWVFFLVFPVVAIVNGDHAVWLKAVSLALVALFALIYVQSFRRMPIWIGPRFNHGRSWVRLVALAAITLALVPTLGAGAVGLAPFLVAHAAFLLPQPWPYLTFAFAATLGVTLAIRNHDPALATTLLPISFAILVSGVVTRTLIGRDAQRDELERAALVVAERDRMARDVHDLLGHSLTVIHLKAELATKLLDVDTDRARQELTEISNITEEALAGVRQTVSDRSSGGFAASVDEFVDTLSGAGVDTVVVGDPHEVSGGIVLPLTWVMRELSTNIMRHAHAENCRVEISPGRLVVGDDGDGFDQSRPGNGIRGMRERLAPAGARLETGVSSMGGAQVEVSW